MKPGHKKRFPALLNRAREREERIREAKKAEEEALLNRARAEAEREEKLRQDQAEREDHERQLAKARWKKELEAEEAGTATRIGTMQHDTKPEIQAVAEQLRKSTDLATLTPGKALPHGKELELPSSKRWQVTNHTASLVEHSALTFCLYRHYFASHKVIG